MQTSQKHARNINACLSGIEREWGVRPLARSRVKQNGVLQIVEIPEGKDLRKLKARLLAVNEAIDNSPLQPWHKTALRMELRAHHMVGEFADYIENAKREGAEERREFRSEHGQWLSPDYEAYAEYRWEYYYFNVFPNGWKRKHDLSEAESKRIEQVIYKVFERSMLLGRPKKATRSRP